MGLFTARQLIRRQCNTPPAHATKTPPPLAVTRPYLNTVRLISTLEGKANDSAAWLCCPERMLSWRVKGALSSDANSYWSSQNSTRIL